MTSKNSFFRSAAVYTIANIINASIPFLLLPILTRVLTPADYGTVAMFGVVVSMFGVLTGLSVHGIVGIRYFEMEKKDFPRFITSCLCILLVSTAMVLGGVVILHHWLMDFTALPITWLLLAVLASGSQFVIQIRLVIWQSARQPLHYAALQIAQSTLNASVSLYLVLGFGMAWEGRLIGNVVAILIFGLLALWGLWNTGWIKFPVSKVYMLDALGFGVPLIPHTIGGILIAVADRFIISNILGVEQTGIYMVGLQLGMVLGLIADAFSKTYSPWLFEKLSNKTNLAALKIVGATYLIVFTFIVLALLFWLLLWVSFDLIISSNFEAARNLIGLFILGNAFKGMYYSISGFFFFSSNTHKLSYITFSIGGLQVISTWYFVGLFGITGGAVVFALSNLLFFAVTWKIGSGFVNLPWPNIRLSLDSIFRIK